ncbi:MAG: FecR family protein, partial [Candidatus Cryptobacteroides sp.]
TALWLNVDSRIGGALTADSGEETIVTSRGQQKEVIFQDGSSVILNGESALTYPRRFGIAQRKVSLEGEALFKVSQNKRRPFIVSLSDNSSVKVLGTTFNINSYDDNPTIDITLMSGLVEFHNEEKIYSMKPDECLSYNKATGDVSISQLKNSNISSLWTENILVFNDTPLERVLQTLSRYYDIDFEIADTAVKKCSYSLKTQKGADIDEVLDDLASISPVKFVKRNGIVTVHSTK